jgi:hypothetical protein
MVTKDIVAEGIKTHILTLLSCEKGFNLGGFAVQNLTVERISGLLNHELMYSLHTLIPAEKMKEESHTFIMKYPRNWKEAFKKEHFPEWLKKRYPVKYMERTETVKFTAYNLYPRFPAIYPDRCKGSIQRIVTEYDYSGDVKE